MTLERPRAALVVGTLLVLVAGAVTPLAGAAPVDAGPRAAQPVTQAPDNATAGSVVADGVTAQGTSLGEPVDPSSTTFDAAFYARVSSFAAAYNDRRPDLGAAGEFAKGNVVNLHVLGPDGDAAVVSFRLTEDNRITDLRAGPRSDAAIRMEMETGTFDRIAEASNPGAAFKQRLDDGDVTITRRGALSGPVETLIDLVRDLVGGG